MLLARRAFVSVWILLGVAGALNHTIGERAFGRRLDFGLPHLKYGHVMFATNSRVVRVPQYAGPDGVRHSIADLVSTPAPFYKRSRVAIDVMLSKLYLNDICRRAVHGTDLQLKFFDDEYDPVVDRLHPVRTKTYACDRYAFNAE